VWKLYGYAVERFGAVSTLIEWDESIPPFGELCAEAERARAIACRRRADDVLRRPDDQPA